jgi:TonB family protein
MKFFLFLATFFCFYANAQSPVATINHNLSLNDCVPPPYPSSAKSRSEQGSVELTFRVAGNGVVSDAAVKKSSGYIDLDNAAITAIKFCKFNVTNLIPQQGTILSSGKFTFRIEDSINIPLSKPSEQYKAAYKISCEAIKYPALAKAFNKEGKTTVSFIVGVDGSTRSPEIKVSSGSDLLDSASKENIEKCKYAPATLNGSPIESVMQQVFNWRFAKTAKTIDPPFLNLHPQVKVCSNIEYPSVSWRIEEEGTSRIKVFISKDGEVEKSGILKSSGSRRLDEAARTVLNTQCKYEKLKMGNEFVAYSVVFEYTWDMEKANQLKILSLDI